VIVDNLGSHSSRGTCATDLRTTRRFPYPTVRQRRRPRCRPPDVPRGLSEPNHRSWMATRAESMASNISRLTALRSLSVVFTAPVLRVREPAVSRATVRPASVPNQGDF